MHFELQPLSSRFFRLLPLVMPQPFLACAWLAIDRPTLGRLRAGNHSCCKIMFIIAVLCALKITFQPFSLSLVLTFFAFPSFVTCLESYKRVVSMPSSGMTIQPSLILSTWSSLSLHIFHFPLQREASLIFWPGLHYQTQFLCCRVSFKSNQKVFGVYP